jgi:transposase
MGCTPPFAWVRRLFLHVMGGNKTTFHKLIVFVFSTEISWNVLPHELGCGSGVTCWRRLREWQRAGLWDRLNRTVLDRLGQEGLLDWSRAAVGSV